MGLALAKGTITNMGPAKTGKVLTLGTLWLPLGMTPWLASWLVRGAGPLPTADSLLSPRPINEPSLDPAAITNLSADFTCMSEIGRDGLRT